MPDLNQSERESDPRCFSAAKISGNFINQLLQKDTAVAGIRVYNAKNQGSVNVGLVFVAVDQAGRELVSDRNGDGYFFYDGDNESICPITKDEARTKTLNACADTSIANLIAVFNKTDFRQAWGRTGVPGEMILAPTSFMDINGTNYNSANFQLQMSPGIEEVIVNGMPCPPYCPNSNEVFLYDINF